MLSGAYCNVWTNATWWRLSVPVNCDAVDACQVLWAVCIYTLIIFVVVRRIAVGNFVILGGCLASGALSDSLGWCFPEFRRGAALFMWPAPAPDCARWVREMFDAAALDWVME